jgi:MFS family permease
MSSMSGEGIQQSAMAEWRWGWRAITASIIGMGFGVNLQYYVSSIFITHYTAEFGWSRGDIANASIALLIAGFFAPGIGALMDRFGARPIFLVGLIVYSLSCLGMANMSGSIIEYYLLYFLMVAFGMATGVLMWSRVIGGAFNKSRGLALSVGMASITFTAMIAPPLLQSIIAEYGWRAGWQAMAVISFAAGMIAYLFFPRQVASKAVSARLSELKGALGKRDFWLAVFGMFILNIPSGGILNQMAALINEKGIDPASVAFIMSAFALSVFVGRFLTGVGLDRLPTRFVTFTVFAVPALGCIALANSTASTPWLVALGIIVVGMSQGAEGDVGPFVIAKRFGMRAFGSLMGGIVFATSLGVSLGAIIFGAIYDATGGYQLAYWVGMACFMAGALCYLMIGHGQPAHAAAEPARN